MTVLAGAFLTFVGFLFGGLLALAFAVALDRKMGKEKALLLFSGLLLLFTLWQCSPPAVKSNATAGTERRVPSDELNIRGVPYDHPPLARDLDYRNPFRKHSDTHPLAPITLALPPWLDMSFSLPPTVPGPAPGARRVLRGERPTAAAGDGSTIPEIPDPVFADYQPVADDLYDWIYSSGRKNYVYILSLRKDGRVYKEGEEGFVDRSFELADHVTGWESLQVEYALIGGEDVASSKLERTDVLDARLRGVSVAPATQFENWFLRRSVDNLYREALTDNNLALEPSATEDLPSLRAAATRMAEVGRTGKESREGWRRAVILLRAAMERARARAAPAIRAEILEELVTAHVALRDEEAVLGALSEYARTSPKRPEPWLWLGRLHLKSLGIAEEALAYFEMALARAPRNTEALLGKGDALTALGLHEDALDHYKRAGTGPDAKVRTAEAFVRLGQLQSAAFALAGATGGDEESPRASLVHGAILYAENDLEKAREAFLRAALATGETALEYRAQACYDLGLTCWRLGQIDAAVAAFDACEQALRFGSSPQRFADEAVSPAFGRALIALAADDDGEVRAALQEAREEAPRVSYHEMLTGMIASRANDHAGAVRAFDRALRLTLSYPELDEWLARTRLALGLGALRAGTPIEEASADFEAAAAFAARASRNEEKADGKAYGALVREAWILLSAEHLQTRRRFEAAREVTRRILGRIDREQPAALTLQGYCNYRLAAFGNAPFGASVNNPLDACIRDFQQVLNKVPPDDEGMWRGWRDYSEASLASIKHWQSLEEKIVQFDEETVAIEWKVDEAAGVGPLIEDGVITLDDQATKDGTIDSPTFSARSDVLFKVGTFEEIRLKLRIPSRGADGAAINTITFGVQVQRTTRGGSRARHSGIGAFYDRGKIALRIGGGQIERFKDGTLSRTVPEMDWPTDEWVEIRILRDDAREGHFEIWLDPDPNDGEPGIRLLEEGEIVSGFKGRSATKAEVWIGGFSTQAQQWHVQIKDIVVIRRK